MNRRTHVEATKYFVRLAVIGNENKLHFANISGLIGVAAARANAQQHAFKEVAPFAHPDLTRFVCSGQDRLAPLTRLTELMLDGTGMGDAGAAALGAALGGAPALEKLVVGENAFGAAAAEGLKAACEARGVAAMASYFDAL